VTTTLNGVLQCGCPGNQELVGGACVSGFNKVQFAIQTGNDNAGSGDEITVKIDGQASGFCLKPSQNMRSDGVCNNGSGATDQTGNSTWNNWQQVTESFTLNPPVSSNQNLNELFITLLQNSCGLSCDNWDLQSIKVTLIDTTGALPQKTLLNVGNPRNNNNNNNCIARMRAPSNSSQAKFLLNGLNGGGTFSNGDENGQSSVCTSGNS
jgi:hypothetical protein